MLELDTISGFGAPAELARFESFLRAHIESGELEEIGVDLSYRQGELAGGKWFRVVKNGALWRLILPDPPFLGLFEPVFVSGSGPRNMH